METNTIHLNFIWKFIPNSLSFKPTKHEGDFVTYKFGHYMMEYKGEQLHYYPLFILEEKRSVFSSSLTDFLLQVLYPDHDAPPLFDFELKDLLLILQDIEELEKQYTSWQKNNSKYLIEIKTKYLKARKESAKLWNEYIKSELEKKKKFETLSLKEQKHILAETEKKYTIFQANSKGTTTISKQHYIQLHYLDEVN